MAHRGSDDPSGLVPHSRFGDRSEPSGFDVPLEMIRAYYCYDDEILELIRVCSGHDYVQPPVFPESAIPADVSHQRYTVRPRYCYVDMLMGCRTCGRDFIFFAREQQYWFEELRFWVGTDCVHCPECRKRTRHLRQRFQRFSDRIGKDAISNEEFATLVEDAIFLWEAGVLRNEQKLRRLKNLALSHIPESEPSKAIIRLISKIKEKEGDF